MSLTSQLDDKNSPIRQFLNETFPNTKSFLNEARKRLRNAQTIKPVGHVSYGTIGTAIDYRIRYYFGETPPNQVVAWNGASRTVVQTIDIEQGEATVWTAEGLQLNKGLVDSFFAELTGFLKAKAPGHRKMNSDEDLELAKYCYVLALFEEVYRAPQAVSDSLLFRRDFMNANELLESLPMNAMEDICNLSALFFDRFKDSFDLTVILNPTFSGSADVGGADCDLILDRTLIDIKATIRPIIKPEWIYQVLGYTLLDYDNAYELSGIGLYMARQGLLIDWSWGEIQNHLAADPTKSMPELREQFKSIAHGLRK